MSFKEKLRSSLLHVIPRQAIPVYDKIQPSTIPSPIPKAFGFRPGSRFLVKDSGTRNLQWNFKGGPAKSGRKGRRSNRPKGRGEPSIVSLFLFCIPTGGSWNPHDEDALGDFWIRSDLGCKLDSPSRQFCTAVHDQSKIWQWLSLNLNSHLTYNLSFRFYSFSLSLVSESWWNRTVPHWFVPPGFFLKGGCPGLLSLPIPPTNPSKDFLSLFSENHLSSLFSPGPSSLHPSKSPYHSSITLEGNKYSRLKEVLTRTFAINVKNIYTSSSLSVLVGKVILVLLRRHFAPIREEKQDAIFISKSNSTPLPTLLPFIKSKRQKLKVLKLRRRVLLKDLATVWDSPSGLSNPRRSLPFSNGKI